MVYKILKLISFKAGEVIYGREKKGWICCYGFR